MLNSLKLLRAMNGIHEEDVVMAENSYFDEKQVKHFKTKRIITFALAATLILSLAITAYAAGLLAPIFHKMQNMFIIPSKEDDISPEFAEGVDQYASDMQDRIDLYAEAEQYMNEVQPESETVALPEFNNSAIILSERYYNGNELLLGVNLKESVPAMVIGYEPNEDLMKELNNIAFFWDVKGNDDLDALLEAGMTQMIYDAYLAKRTDYAREYGFRHLSAIEFDWMLKTALTPEEYEEAWRTLRETGHLCVVQSQVYIGDHLTLEDGTDLGPSGQTNMDSNDVGAHSGHIFIEMSNLPVEARNLDRLDFLLHIKQVRVYYYMELGGPAYFYTEIVGASDVPFSVENSGT